MIDEQIVNVNSLFTRLNQLSLENKQAVADLSQAISKILNIPLKVIIETTQTLQEGVLSPRQQQELISKIQHLSNESLNILNNLVALSESMLIEKTAKTSHEDFIDTSCLAGIQTLLIDDDNKRRDALQIQLQTLGLICNAVNIEGALPALQQALQTNAPYEIVIVSGEHFDHHAAYLGRTIKANTLYHSIMPVLALATHKPFDFEIERAYFSGFNCILNQTQPLIFPKKLATAWQSWLSKAAFRQPSVDKQQRILIVEDEPTAQFSVQHQLEGLGFSVDIATDGRKALRLLENKQYALIFMDIGLPDISGLEVTAEIRKREQGKIQTPIIGLTVYALEEDEKQGLDVGMDDYLVKPLTQNRLQDVLQKWLKQNA